MTDKQKAEVEAVRKDAERMGRRIGWRMMGLLVAGCLVINIVNQLTVQNDYFVMMMAAVTGVMVFQNTIAKAKEQQQVLRTRIEKIFNEDN